MRRSIATAFLSGFLVAGTLAAAESPFAGTWKLNQAKSNLTGDTMTFADEGGGTIRHSFTGLSNTFKTDGKSYSTAFGNTAVWKQLDANTWQATYSKGERVINVDTMKVSADGKTLNIQSKGPKPTGGSFDDTSVYVRTSGQSGLIGTWKSKDVKLSAPGLLEIKTSGADGITLKNPEYQASCDAKFDGTDYPVTGPTVAEAFTLSFTRAGPNTFTMQSKLKGKHLSTEKYTVSADRKTLTLVSTPVAVDEPQTWVFDKQ
jgi:hypothetical protein